MEPQDQTAAKINSPSVNPNKALWEKGDFTQIAATMRESGEALVARVGIRKGRRWLGQPTANPDIAIQHGCRSTGLH